MNEYKSVHAVKCVCVSVNVCVCVSVCMCVLLSGRLTMSGGNFNLFSYFPHVIIFLFSGDKMIKNHVRYCVPYSKIWKILTYVQTYVYSELKDII